MRESRTSGSEGGAAQLNAPSLPLSRRLGNCNSLRGDTWLPAPGLR